MNIIGNMISRVRHEAERLLREERERMLLPANSRLCDAVEYRMLLNLDEEDNAKQ